MGEGVVEEGRIGEGVIMPWEQYSQPPADADFETEGEFKLLSGGEGGRPHFLLLWPSALSAGE